MRHVKSVCVLCMILFGIIPSCDKNRATVEYVAAERIVKKGEPFVITATPPDPNSIIRWSIRPSENTQINPSGNQATILISQAGSYLITANFYLLSDTTRVYNSSYSTITVNDSIYIPPVISAYDTVSLAGDELTLVPSSISGNLELTVKTTRNYKCTSNISAIGFYQPKSVGSPIILFFDSAIIAISKSGCGGATNPATANISFLPFVNGTYPILASLNQITFSGNLIVTDTNYRFVWFYSSGLLISPLQVNKQ